MVLEYKDLMAGLHAGKYLPVYLLTGEENYYIDHVSDWMEQHIVEESLRDFDQVVLYGKDVNMENVVGEAMRFPMMSPIRLVLVKEAQDIAIKEWDLLKAYLSNPSPQTVLVFCYRHKKLDKRTAAYKAIAQVGGVYESTKLYDNQVPGWISTEATSHGHPISDREALLLSNYLGNDLGKISNELSKLYSLLPQGAPIEAQLIEEQVGISKEYNVFELQKAIGRRDPLMCNRIVNYFADNTKKHPIQMLLPALYGWVLKVMFYHQLENKSDAPKVLGCPPLFVNDYAQAAHNYSLGKLALCVGYLYEADLKSKGVQRSSTTADGEILKELVFKIIH